MPIIIQDEVLTEKIRKFDHFINDNLIVKNLGKELLQKEIQRIDLAGLLYVNQREFAVISNPDSRVHTLGSDDATTCHIITIRHTGSGVCGLLHCDSEENHGLDQLCSKVLDLSKGMLGSVEISIVGGFKDKKGYSHKISKAVLNFFILHSESFHLTCCCITDLNDIVRSNIHYPIFYGLGLNVKTGQVFPAMFDHKGPDLDLRAARIMTFSQANPVIDIYNSCADELTIGPYDWTEQDVMMADYCLKYPDKQIRQRLSTSPEQEPEHFEHHMREAFTVITTHPQPSKSLFGDGQPRKYTMNSEGMWVRV